jgi:GT2 family glycosyltransferase
MDKKSGLLDIPGISIVLGSYNRLRFLKLTIKSIRNNGIAVPYEIIVIDGGSTDGSMAWLIKQKDIITIVQHNQGIWKGTQIKRRSWGYFMNLGFKSAHRVYMFELKVYVQSILKTFLDYFITQVSLRY